MPTDDEDTTEVEEEEEEEEEEETGTGSDPEDPPSPPPKAAAAPPPRAKPVGRPKKKRPSPGVGAAPEPPLPPADDFRKPFSSQYADQILDELYDRIQKFPEIGFTVYDVEVECWSLDGTVGTRVVGHWPMQTFQPDRTKSAGEKLRDTVIDQVHFVISRGQPVTYDIRFLTRSPRRIVTRGLLPLGSPAEIDALRRAQWEAARNSGAPYGAPTGHAGIPAAPSAPAPGYGSAPGGYGVPPAASAPTYAPYPGGGFGAPGGYDATSQLREELRIAREQTARTEGQLQEVLSALREGRTPNVVTPPPAQAAPAGTAGPGDLRQVVREEVAQVVGAGFAEIRQALGIGPQGRGVAAPPSPGARLGDAILQSAEKLVQGMVTESLSQLGSHMKTQIKAGMGLGSTPEPDPDPDPDDLPEPPPKPEDSLPFVTAPTGAQWSDGRPVMRATDKSTGAIHWEGMLWSNPVFVEQGMGAVGAILTSVKEIASRVTLPNGTQVVGKTPSGAVDGTPRQHAAPPPPPPEPPPAPQPRPIGGASPPNGVAAPGARSPSSSSGFVTH